jgi:HK97 family phage portal protein
MKASIIGLPPGEQPDRPLEKTWDDQTVLSTYLDDPWPYICATKVAEQGSLPALKVGRETRDGDFKPVPPTHGVQQLLDRPNPQYTGGEWRQLLLLYMEMVGHAPIEVVRPFDGARVRGASRQGFELYVHNPSPWRIVPEADGSIRGYLYYIVTGAGNIPQPGPQNTIKWTPEQMTYLRWPNPMNRWYGQGRIAAARQAVMAEEYAAIRDKKFEQQMGVPPGILTTDNPIGGPQADELQRRWEQAVGGYRNAGRIAILGSGATYQPVQMSRTDAEWIKSREWRVDEICGAFGIPKVLVIMGSATFANAKEARSEFWEGTLQPRLERIQEMVTERLLPLLTDEPLVARFDFSHIDALNENKNEVATRAESWVKTGVTTKKEVRSLLGLAPFGDERDDELASPTAIRDTVQATTMAQAEEAPGTADQPLVEKPPAKTPAKGKALSRDREQVLGPVRSAYQRDLGSFFKAQRGALQSEGLLKFSGDDLIRRAIELLSAPRFRERLQRISKSPIETALALGAADAAQAISVGVSFAIDASPEALRAVNAQLVGLAEALQGTTIDDVTKVIVDDLAAGVEYGVLQDDLGALFDGYADWRVDRIARTEVTRAYNTGSIGQYRDGGVSQVYVTDGDGDEPCAAADGQTWTLEQAESDPISHPNCTRSFDPIPPDEMPGIQLAATPKRTQLLYDESGRLTGWEDS